MLRHAYYNEHDAVAAQWLRNLIAAGHIADGDVDERSIEDVAAADLVGYRQCHFFAGIGVWSYALRTAGWADDRPVWTGSCPCQPFSAAGKREGHQDERHLWPAWFRLIRKCRPTALAGEQVAGHDGLAWLDAVCADLEDAGYAVAAANLCAAGVGAPHIRQRLYWMADAGDTGARAREEARASMRAVGDDARPSGADGGVADPARAGLGVHGRRGIAGSRDAGSHADEHHERDRRSGAAIVDWRDADWLRCRDGRWRPVEPGTFPLAHGIAGRVGRLRAYGNDLVAPQATAFIEAVMECV